MSFSFSWLDIYLRVPSCLDGSISVRNVSISLVKKCLWPLKYHTFSGRLRRAKTIQIVSVPWRCCTHGDSHDARNTLGARHDLS